MKEKILSFVLVFLIALMFYSRSATPQQEGTSGKQSTEANPKTKGGSDPKATPNQKESPGKSPAEAKAAAGGAPHLVFDKMQHDFGEIKQQQAVKHIFLFRNDGDALLVIEKVKPTCGCTGTLLSAKEIQPGGKGEIEVTFKSGMSSGKKKKSIYVYSNDSEKPSQQLHIAANIVVPVEARPRQLYWVAERSAESKRVVQLLHQPNLEVNIVGLEFSSPAFKGSFSPKGEGKGSGYDIEVLFDGSLPTGNFKEQLTIVTDNPEYPTFMVYLRGRVMGKIRVVPNVAALGVVKSDDFPSRTIRIFAKDNRDFKIESIEPTSPLLSTEISSDEGSNGYQIHVELNAKPPRGAFSEKLSIKTDIDPENPLLVDVYAYVQ